MQITRKTDYGLRAISELARRPEEATPIAHIAQRHGIPDSFLEKIMQELRQAGLVEATHGRSGGYRLARLPQQISLKEVVHALEGPIALVMCLDPNLKCKIELGCPTSNAWTLINTRFEESLSTLTLEDILTADARV
ncbi:MAG TPA: Rrf2 family transcriptional regulator [Candidatus Bipolaricaulota bacterium]